LPETNNRSIFPTSKRGIPATSIVSPSDSPPRNESTSSSGASPLSRLKTAKVTCVLITRPWGESLHSARTCCTRTRRIVGASATRSENEGGTTLVAQANDGSEQHATSNHAQLLRGKEIGQFRANPTGATVAFVMRKLPPAAISV
jgi:hypothetical protein